jgi:hypothetical protein
VFVVTDESFHGGFYAGCFFTFEIVDGDVLRVSIEEYDRILEEVWCRWREGAGEVRGDALAKVGKFVFLRELRLGEALSTDCAFCACIAVVMAFVLGEVEVLGAANGVPNPRYAEVPQPTM